VKIDVDRSFLEINTIENLNQSKSPGPNFKIIKVDPPDFQLNRFFYKQIGRKHRWIDRLTWGDKKWIEYVENPRIKTFVLKDNNNLAGYYETIRDQNNDHCEIAYFGVLEEYIGKKCGGYLLSEAIKSLFEEGMSRVWLHTCSLDHENAIKNYLARGMQVFKSEKINVELN
jgi:ribosomal protein S18 acetylase RimI-like enzyme